MIRLQRADHALRAGRERRAVRVRRGWTAGAGGQPGAGEELDVELRRRGKHPGEEGVRVYDGDAGDGAEDGYVWLRERTVVRRADELRRTDDNPCTVGIIPLCIRMMEGTASIIL